MSCTRNQIVVQARSWLGCNESDGSHKKIIDVYNSHKPLAVGYKLKYTDAWCSGFVSACAIACNATDIIPTEVGCGRHISLFQKMGIWVEDDAYIPSTGDIIFYSWSDTGVGDRTTGASHVGIVEKVEGNTIIVIEGNYSNSVKRRTLAVNGKYIRGYGVPKYDEEEKTNAPTTAYKNVVAIELPVLRKGDKGEQVKTLQRLLFAMRYELGDDPIDGIFGGKTHAAVIAFQRSREIAVDGIVGEETWSEILGV